MSLGDISEARPARLATVALRVAGLRGSQDLRGVRNALEVIRGVVDVAPTADECEFVVTYEAGRVSPSQFRRAVNAMCCDVACLGQPVPCDVPESGQPVGAGETRGRALERREGVPERRRRPATLPAFDPGLQAEEKCA